MPTPHLLVVDDTPANLIAFEAALEPLGYPIVLARSGRQALRHLLALDFSLILMDVNMPDLNGIDTVRGSQLSMAFGFAGLGGDVRTYHPQVSYTRFMPIRKRRSKNPEVFAFRVQAGTIGAFAISDAIRNANSIAFVGGIPIYERFFLGSENDIRGYTSRAIGPIAPFDTPCDGPFRASGGMASRASESPCRRGEKFASQAEHLEMNSSAQRPPAHADPANAVTACHPAAGQAI